MDLEHFNAEAKNTKMDPKEIVFIIGNPATGKTTLADKLNTAKGYDILKSITTRKPRNEDDYRWYRFVSKEEMEKYIDNNEVLEYNKYGEEVYATSSEDLTKGNTRMVKVIEPNGLHNALQFIKEHIPQAKTAIVLLNIDKQCAYENLINEGYTHEEAEKRINRPDILIDMDKNDIEPDLIIDTLKDPSVIADHVDMFVDDIFLSEQEKEEKLLKKTILTMRKYINAPYNEGGDWWNNREIILVLSMAEKKGWVSYLSVTQVQWTEEGAKRAQNLLKADKEDTLLSIESSLYGDPQSNNASFEKYKKKKM